jgi:hypothetical protein
MERHVWRQHEAQANPITSDLKQRTRCTIAKGNGFVKSDSFCGNVVGEHLATEVRSASNRDHNPDATDLSNRDQKIVTDHDGLADGSTQHQHRAPSFRFVSPPTGRVAISSSP